MPNIFEAVVNTLKSFVDSEPKNPLHIGEANQCWFYLTSLQEALIYEQAALNTTIEDDLIQALNDGVKMCKKQIKELREFMIKEGVTLPEASEDKPQTDPNQIPYGVKLTDDEIANGISLKIASMTVACSISISQSVRNDFGIMFLRFHTEMVTFGASLKMLLREKGWIKVPPYYTPPGSITTQKQ
jgi:hypothetical protein